MTPEAFAALLAAICSVESSNRPHVINHNDGGSASHGYCQLKEKTARFMGFRGDVKELLKKEVNKKYAALYLRYQLKRYKGNIRYAVAAYNRGSIRLVNGKLSNRKYVEKVLKTLEGNNGRTKKDPRGLQQASRRAEGVAGSYEAGARECVYEPGGAGRLGGEVRAAACRTNKDRKREGSPPEELPNSHRFLRAYAVLPRVEDL